MSQKIKVLIPICEVPENSIVYKGMKGKIPYIVKHILSITGDDHIIILLGNSGEFNVTSTILRSPSTEVIWETDLDTLNNIYGDK